MDNRFYLLALGITGLFVVLLILFGTALGGPASEAAIQNADRTRTSIAMTGSYLLQPRTRTPLPITDTVTSLPQTSAPLSTATVAGLPSPTNTSLLAQFSTPLSPVASTLAPLASQTTAPIPLFTTTALPGGRNTKAPPLLPQTPTPTFAQAPATGMPSPAEFADWYFTRVWTERDYQNLWDNYLTPSFKANVGSGLFEDYVFWWNSVQRVDVNAVDVLQNNGSDAWVRVNLTFHMMDARVVENQIYEYDFLYDSSRGTWMFDSSS